MTATASLDTASPAVLKDAYREIRRRELAGDPDANEARRQLTIRMLRVMSRDEVRLFESEERATEELRRRAAAEVSS